MTALRQNLLGLLLLLSLSTQASAKGTGYVFVTNVGTNNIAVIDPKQDYRVIRWIGTSRGPRDMKFRDDRKQLLVACGEDDVIDVIDVATLMVIDHIPTGANPEMFELSRDQKTLYVPNKAGSVIQQVDIADKIIEREISTGAEPDGIAFGGDGKTLYVTSEMNDWVHVIDLEAGAVIKNIVVGTHPRRFLLMPDEKELWVSNEWSGQVSIIDRQTNRITGNLDFLAPGSSRQIDVTPVDMAMTKDGRTAFVTLGRAGYVAFVDTVTRKIQSYVLVGKDPRGLALSSDAKTLYVADGQSDDLSVVDVPSHKVIETAPVGHAPYSVQVDDLTKEASTDLAPPGTGRPVALFITLCLWSQQHPAPTCREVPLTPGAGGTGFANLEACRSGQKEALNKWRAEAGPVFGFTAMAGDGYRIDGVRCGPVASDPLISDIDE
jgi:PQQ-dependent catabolism-associated beta-propeller protein